MVCIYSKINDNSDTEIIELLEYNNGIYSASLVLKCLSCTFSRNMSVVKKLKVVVFVLKILSSLLLSRPLYIKK